MSASQWDGVYDTAEVSILERMRRTLIAKHGFDADDFEGMTFLDVESEFLEYEEDFR